MVAGGLMGIHDGLLQGQTAALGQMRAAGLGSLGSSGGLAQSAHFSHSVHFDIPKRELDLREELQKETDEWLGKL